MAQCLGISMEILDRPSDKILLLAFLMLSRAKPSNTPGIRSAAGVAGKIAKLQSGLRGSTPGFSFGLTPLAFHIHKVTTRQWCYLTHSWGSKDKYKHDKTLDIKKQSKLHNDAHKNNA